MTLDTEGRREVLGDLYAAAAGNRYRRAALDDLVTAAGYGWRCTGVLSARDGGGLCGYLNVPVLFEHPDEKRCLSCGTERPSR